MESVERKRKNNTKFMPFMKYSKQFKGKSDAEIKWLVCQIGDPELVDLYVVNYADMIDCYLKICQNDKKMLCDRLYQILMKCPDQCFVCDKLHLIDDMKLRKELVLSIDDLFVRSIATKHLEENDRIEVLSMIKNNEILKDAYLKEKNINILCAINDDEFKVQHLSGYAIWIPDQVKIICSMESDEIKYCYIQNPVFHAYIEEIANSFKEFSYKYRVFCEYDNLEFRLNLIAKTSNPKEFNSLLDILPDSVYKDIFRMSLPENKKDLLKCINISSDKIIENDDLKFKLSFDIDVWNVLELNNFTKIFTNWEITQNPYNQNIMTVISPELKCSKEGFKEVKVICNFFNKYYCRPVASSNLKIKFNFGYFKTYQEFIGFLMLYLYSENILNYICNKEYQGYCEGKTQPFSNLLRYLHEVHHNYYLPGNLNETVRMMNDRTDSDCYSLSLLNCLTDEGMIEFKMADSEFDFEQLCKTIKLFVKVMEKGKFMANINEKKNALVMEDKLKLNKINLQMLMNAKKEHKNLSTIKELINDMNVDSYINDLMNLKDVDNGEEKLDLLLKILFDGENTFDYRCRFNSNIYVHRMNR